MKNGPKKEPIIPTNPRRRAAKLKRNRGLGAMKKNNSTEAQWAQYFDPLFKVKGQERHNRMGERK